MPKPEFITRVDLTLLLVQRLFIECIILAEEVKVSGRDIGKAKEGGWLVRRGG
jgi:hypothetical protein